MPATTIRIAIANAGRSIELEGDPSQVREMLDEFRQWLTEPAQTPSGANAHFAPLADQNGNAVVPAPAGPGNAGSFGEYLHSFRPGITDVDRVLVAAQYAQNESEDSTFATRNLNQLLQEQGIRVANPSQCVRRNVGMRRVFTVARGRFRVSRDGQQYLETLRD